MGFTGFGPGAVAFYQELELNNSKEWWAGHRQIYDEAVKTPMLALLAELEDEFGSAKVFRPHRDVRFSADKSPYKTHQGAYVPTVSASGFYLQIGPEGLMIGGGMYQMQPDQLARYRAAVDTPAVGQTLEATLDSLRGNGYEIGGDLLATRPRGVDADHPRLELMRHRSLVASRAYGEPDWLATPETLERVRSDWRGFRPLIDWLGAHVGDTTRRPGPSRN